MSKKDIKADKKTSQVEETATETIQEPETKEASGDAKEHLDGLTPEEKLQEELAKEKDKFMRLFAEFENYKKRTTRERIELFKTASQDVMVAMLPILDDFERALTHIEEDKEAEELRKGVLLIYQKLMSTLEQKGLSKIEVKQGDAFNADDHEAVTQVPAPSDDLKGKIIVHLTILYL